MQGADGAFVCLVLQEQEEADKLMKEIEMHADIITSPAHNRLTGIILATVTGPAHLCVSPPCWAVT